MISRCLWKIVFLLALLSNCGLVRSQDPSKEGAEPKETHPDGYCFYRALQLGGVGATAKEIEDSYRTLIEAYPEVSWGATHSIHLKIQEAYDVLSNPDAKEIYDMYGMKGFEAWERGERDLSSFTKRSRQANNAALGFAISKMRTNGQSEERIQEMIDYVADKVGLWRASSIDSVSTDTIAAAVREWMEANFRKPKEKPQEWQQLNQPTSSTDDIQRDLVEYLSACGTKIEEVMSEEELDAFFVECASDFVQEKSGATNDMSDEEIVERMEAVVEQLGDLSEEKIRVLFEDFKQAIVAQQAEILSLQGSNSELEL